jgi:hypothetical protein
LKTEICKELYTLELLRASLHKIFVFGDNMKRYGKRGQAIIRDEPNVFGVATKRYPSMDEWAFFSDKTDELNCVRDDLRVLYRLGVESVIVFPEAGIGTGLAMMKEKSPKILGYMNRVLLEHFWFENKL